MCAYCFSEQWLISPVTPTEKSQGSLGRELALDPGVEGESLECIVGSEAFSDEVFEVICSCHVQVTAILTIFLDIFFSAICFGSSFCFWLVPFAHLK